MRVCPYHFDLNNKLRRIASENKIRLINDIYSYYASDGSAYWRAGGGARVALFGPGVASSHGYERSHRDSPFRYGPFDRRLSAGSAR